MYKKAEKIIRRRWEEEMKREKEKREKEIEEALKPMKENFELEKKEMRKGFKQRTEEQQRQWIRKEKEWNDTMRQKQATFRQNVRSEAERGEGGVIDFIVDSLVAIAAGAFAVLGYLFS